MRAGLAALSVLTLAACADTPTSPVATPQVATSAQSSQTAINQLSANVGEQLFNDTRLSVNGKQSCASCHDVAFGFTSPNTSVNAGGAVNAGAFVDRFGGRKAPTAAYSTYSPVLHYDAIDDTWVGGMFWDGRATGQLTGTPAGDQALGPFLNHVEMALADKACVMYAVATSSYAARFRQVWGKGIDGVAFPANTRTLCAQEGTTVALSAADRATIDAEYLNVGRSIAAFEASDRVSPFNSRYDGYLKGSVKFTAQELEGLDLFENKAGCAGCHPNDGDRALFTDFTYDNIGVPSNPQNPALLSNASFADLGLGGFLNDPSRHGAHKVPTLRNIDKRRSVFDVKSYMHNGAFKSLAQVVHFYNTRDVLPTCVGVVLWNDPRFGTSCWPAPEVAANVNGDELGNLGLTPKEEAALVAYLKTLSDR
jgi:cytochrome c peroxidase